MNAYLISVILGIVEGLTEFIPVSSTAHLRISEALLHIDLKNDYWKMYSVVIQLGAILSVLVLYAKRLGEYARTFPRGGAPLPAPAGFPVGEFDASTPHIGRPRPWYRHPFALITIAFVATAGPAYFLTKQIGEALESPYVIGTALLVGGIVMWVVDIVCTRPVTTSIEQMSMLDALWIGVIQILSAVFPGTSRSMCTIAAGQVFGMSRSAALDFSFLVSLPVMFAACGYSFLKSLKEFRTNPAFIPADLHANPWVVLAIGFVVSFLVALLVNRWFINWVKSKGFAPFAIYRLALGTGVLIWAFTRTAP